MSALTDRMSFGHGFAAALRAASLKVMTRVKSIVAAMTRRKQIEALSRLDDRTLADMGLTRGDLAEAARWSLWDDAGDRLAAVAEERRILKSLG